MWSCECAHIWSMCTCTCDVATCVCASVWCVHIHMLHAVKTSVCGVCHYRQPCVYNSVHESHEAHTPHNAVTASASVVCGRWRRFTCVTSIVLPVKGSYTRLTDTYIKTYRVLYSLRKF